VLRSSILFALGTLLLHQLPQLPHPLWSLLALPLLAAAVRFRPMRPAAALAAGFFWSQLYGTLTAPGAIPADGEVLDLVAEGHLVSLVERDRNPARFVFEIDRVEGLEAAADAAWRVRLSWRDPPALQPGQRWRLALRLRAAHGYATPGAWDYEGWLYWQGIRYTGYVRGEAQLLGDTPGCCRLTRLRNRLSQALDEVPASEFARGVMRAITLGDTSGLSREARSLFRDTGTSHLMAISGLHIGLVAGLGVGGLAWLWRRLPALCARVPAMAAGALFGLLLAAVYALLAGFALPTQRALIMLAVFALALVRRRQSSPGHALALAMFMVLLWHPPSILSAGFWLSFGAVLVIFAVLGRSENQARWRQAVRVQLALSLALWPVLGFFGLPASTLAPLVNLLLVPLFGLFVVPASLLAMLLLTLAPAWGDWLAGLVGAVLDLIEGALAGLVAWPWPPLGQAGPDLFTQVLLLAGVALMLAPHGVPLRALAVPLLLASALPRASHVPPGTFELHLLDVGQGLSSVIFTHRHTLVFDTGPEYPGGFSTAEAVLLPFLHLHGRTTVDRLVLSHGDSDHAGGLELLRRRLRIRRIQSGEVERIGRDARPCVAGTAWTWDGVSFEFLYPPPGQRLSGNDASCVLRVSNRAGSVLFTGDIGRRVERRLAATLPQRLRSDVVVAPHHGSRSSSSAEFVAASAPGCVLYTAGWANRYGFPADEVQARWRAAGATALDTAVSGSISMVFAGDGQLSGPGQRRVQHKRFWHHQTGSAEAGHRVSCAD
jgi:competence protein ComEC